MELIGLFLLPFLAGLGCVLAPAGRDLERRIAIGGFAATVLLAVGIGLAGGDGRWLARHDAPFVPALGVRAQFAMDGLSLALVVTSGLLGIVSVLVSWREIERRSGVFHLLLSWTVAAAIGVFLAFDLLLFVFFWEAMLVPSFLLIALFGHEAREQAAMKYLIYNAVGGVALLGGVLALATGGGADGSISFDAGAIAASPPPVEVQLWLLGAFLLAFLVKLPAIPVHAWLADAHTQAPTAGSILLAGVLLKTGSYGLFRFPAMLFPDALALAAPYTLALGAAGALYGGVLACGQTDAKRLVAYTSVAHMGLVLMGISAGTRLGLAGASVEMIAHALSGSALFLLVGALEQRTGTRDMHLLGGAQEAMPRFAGAFALFFAAALAMPGTANFVGEALVIVGVFQVSWPFAALAIASLVISVVYATRLLSGVLFGERPAGAPVRDLERHELWPAVALAGGTLLFGLAPHLLTRLFAPAIEAVRGSGLS